MENNQDWNRCIDDNSLTLGRCVYNCNNNEQCEDDCLARFKTRQLDCPCEVIFRKNLWKIPWNFRKIVRRDVPAVVLTVLSQHQPRKWLQLLFQLPRHHQLETQFLFWVITIQITNHSLLISTVNICFFLKKFILLSGNTNEDLAFEYGDGATVERGCAATLFNEFWYFGGSNKRQVTLQS